MLALCTARTMYGAAGQEPRCPCAIALQRRGTCTPLHVHYKGARALPSLLGTAAAPLICKVGKVRMK